MGNATPEEEKALMKRWVDQWKVTGPELERIKKEELRAMTDEEALRRVQRVMNSRARHASEGVRAGESSGLIEQQRIFARACPPREESVSPRE